MMPSCTVNIRDGFNIQAAVLANLKQDAGVDSWENQRIAYVIYFWRPAYDLTLGMQNSF